jgi:hypothetical protein
MVGFGASSNSLYGPDHTTANDLNVASGRQGIVHMPISDEIELAAAVAVASEHLQDIHNFAQREIRDDAKVRFPRGVMREAQHYRQLCPDHLEDNRASSCAYAFMWLDVLWWLINRTDLVLTGREMAIKSSIITLGTISEATLTIPFSPGLAMIRTLELD